MESKIEENTQQSIYSENFNHTKEKIEKDSQYDLNIINPSKNFEEIKNINNHKELIAFQDYSLNDMKKLSDLTCISLSQTENSSQASESSLFNPIINTSQNISSDEHNQKDSTKIEEIDYYYGIKNYFLKIMPEKFSEYKKTRNYLPKNLIKENQRYNETNNIENKYNNLSIEDNKFNKYQNISQLNNNLIFPLYENLFYCINNISYFNPFFNLINKKNNQIEEKEKEKEINNNINIKSNKSKNRYNNIDNYKYNNEQYNYKDVCDDIYLIKKQKKYKNFNKNNNNEKKQKINYENINNEFNYYKNNYNSKNKYNNKDPIDYNKNYYNNNQNNFYNYNKNYKYKIDYYYNDNNNKRK